MTLRSSFQVQHIELASLTEVFALFGDEATSPIAIGALPRPASTFSVL